MVNEKFERWAKSQGYDMERRSNDDGDYIDNRTREAHKMWHLVAGRCAQIADEGMRAMSRVKGEGAARCAAAIRAAFGLPRPKPTKG